MTLVLEPDLPGIVQKNPSEVVRYSVDYTEFLDGRTIDSMLVAISGDDNLLIVDSSQVVGNLVVLLLSGGTRCYLYKVKIQLTLDPDPFLNVEIRSDFFEIKIPDREALF